MPMRTGGREKRGKLKTMRWRGVGILSSACLRTNDQRLQMLDLLPLVSKQSTLSHFRNALHSMQFADIVGS